MAIYIHEFRVQNFLIHRDTHLSLSPITVFVGPNGGGKSAIFGAILNFSMVARGNIRQGFGHYPFSYYATKYHGAYPVDRIRFEVVMSSVPSGAERLRYEISYTQKGPADSGSPSFQIFQERLERTPPGEILFNRDDLRRSTLLPALQFVEDDRGILAAVRAAYLEGKDIGNSLVSECAREISKFNRFRLNPFLLAGSSRLPELPNETPRLGHEGEDLAACLYFLQETKNEALETIVAKVRSVAPGFSKFEFNTFGSDRVGFSMAFDDARGTVPSVRSSHGLLLLVGLMVLVYSPNRPPVMLIEEPENGLTPTALREFYRSIRELAFREDETQRNPVLISSHSPFIICEAWNGEDREFIHQVKVQDGCSVVRKFSEAVAEQQIQLAKDDRGGRTWLSLKSAEELMSGYLA